MNIPRSTLEKWKALNTPGDASKMAKTIEGGYPEIFLRAVRIGRCNDEVFTVMLAFYKRKEKELKKILA